MKILASLALIIAAYSSPVLAIDDHVHGQGGIPDWYDPSCCSQHDCKPVADEDVKFIEHNGFPAIRYKPTNNIFYQYQWKTSQDERYHACINPYNANSLCFYIRAGV